MRSFCSGVVRAKITSVYELASWSHCASFRARSSEPLRTIEVGLSVLPAVIDLLMPVGRRVWERALASATALGGLVIIPHSAAIAWAVRAKSPVIWRNQD